MRDFWGKMTRGMRLSALFVALASLFALPAYADAEARELSSSCAIVNEAGASPAQLLDATRGTTYACDTGTVLTITAPEPVHALYLVWDRPPENWFVSADGAAAQLGGQDGFIHEYIALDHPGQALTIRLPAGGSTLCDIYLFTGGTLPDWVQHWQAPCADAELLAVSTHADDELLFFGGVLPTYAGEEGRAVQVVYLTHHWAERYRPHELLDGLWTVGVHHYPVISPFPDAYADSEATARSIYDADAFVQYITTQIRRFKPEVIVGQDENGEYGHGVHILGVAALKEAVAGSGDAAFLPESAARYGIWDTPKVYLHLYPENQLLLEWDTPLARFDGATAYEMARAGFACHASQQSFQLSRSGVFDCRRFGLWRSLVGPDTVGDTMFENIPDPQPEPPAPSSPASVASSPATSETGASSAPATTSGAPDSSSGGAATTAPGRHWLWLGGGLAALAAGITVTHALAGRRHRR